MRKTKEQRELEIRLSARRIQPRAWLPNQAGFKFTAILEDGTHVDCEVEKDDKGSHRVKGRKITEITGWYK
jgi:hypothetical protein